MATAYCTARWPRPPAAPMTVMNWPWRTSVCLTPAYVVTPAHRIGAACTDHDNMMVLLEP
eukprot:1378-Eustigmatos_ZCMA.PRE.1